MIVEKEVNKANAAANNRGTAGKLDELINKYKQRGLLKVSQFLQNIARTSKHSAISYSSGLEHMNSFIIKDPRYKNYNLETIVEPLDSGKIDRYRLINDYISYLQNDSING